MSRFLISLFLTFITHFAFAEIATETQCAEGRRALGLREGSSIRLNLTRAGTREKMHFVRLWICKRSSPTDCMYVDSSLPITYDRVVNDRTDYGHMRTWSDRMGCWNFREQSRFTRDDILRVRFYRRERPFDGSLIGTTTLSLNSLSAVPRAVSVDSRHAFQIWLSR
jgi:hypothetical protein